MALRWDNVGNEPTEQKKTDGFIVNEKPPAGYFNWLFNQIIANFSNYLAISNKASQSDATTGTNDTKYMTPVRVKDGAKAVCPAKYTSAAAPSTSNNTSQGYAYGDLWRDTTTQDLYYYFGDDQDGAVWLNMKTSKRLFFYDDGVFGNGVSNFTTTYLSGSATGFTLTPTDGAGYFGVTLSTSSNSKAVLYGRVADAVIDATKFTKLYIKYKGTYTQNSQATSQHGANLEVFSSSPWVNSGVGKQLTLDNTTRISYLDLRGKFVSAAGALTSADMYLGVDVSTQTPSTSSGTASTSIQVYEIWGE